MIRHNRASSKIEHSNSTHRRKVLLPWLPIRLQREFLMLIQWLHVLDLHSEDILLDVSRERLDLVRRVCVRRDGEHLVEFFEGERFGFGDEEENENEAHDVPGGVPPEGTLRFERSKETGEGDGDDEVTREGKYNVSRQPKRES